MQVDPTAPDLWAFPAFAEVVAVQAVLRPGDVILFPGEPSLPGALSGSFRSYTPTW